MPSIYSHFFAQHISILVAKKKLIYKLLLAVTESQKMILWKLILPINRCITDPKEWPMPKVGRSCTCVKSHYCFLSVISFWSEINYMDSFKNSRGQLTVSCRNRKHRSNLNCTSSAMKKWSNPLGYGVAITKTPLYHSKKLLWCFCLKQIPVHYNPPATKKHACIHNQGLFRHRNWA